MYDIKIIESGNIMADGGAMFGAIPKRAWQRKYACDQDNLCSLAMRCLLVVSDSRRILIDLGMGDKHTQKASYYKPHNLVDISDNLKAFGYSNDDITDVILTHLHFDHCGYATLLDADKKIVPSFRNANYWVSEKQWTHFLLPNPLEKDSIFADNIQPVFDAGLIQLIGENCKLYDGFDLQLYNGHSQGQLVPIIHTAKGIVAFPADLIPTAAHVPLEWISAYDVCALTSYSEKKRFLTEAVDNDYSIVYCHDSYTIQSKVKRINNDFVADKAISI